MASRWKPTPPPGHPWSITWRSVHCNFQGVAPITGDLFYSGQKADGTPVNLITTNPEAHEHQREHFLRGG